MCKKVFALTRDQKETEKKPAHKSIVLVYQYTLLVLTDHPVTSRWWCDD